MNPFQEKVVKKPIPFFLLILGISIYNSFQSNILYDTGYLLIDMIIATLTGIIIFGIFFTRVGIYFILITIVYILAVGVLHPATIDPQFAERSEMGRYLFYAPLPAVVLLAIYGWYDLLKNLKITRAKSKPGFPAT